MDPDVFNMNLWLNEEGYENIELSIENRITILTKLIIEIIRKSKLTPAQIGTALESIGLKPIIGDIDES